MFISKSKRSASQAANAKRDMRDHRVSDLVCYDMTANTISANAKKNVDKINNPIVAQLNAKMGFKNSTTLAFSAKEPRFKKEQTCDEETYIGPGYYEQKSQLKSRSTAFGPLSTAASRAKINATASGDLQRGLSMNILGNASSGDQPYAHAAIAGGRITKPTTAKGGRGVAAVNQYTPGPGHYFSQ